MLKEHPIQNVLEVAERLALAADESAGIVGLHIEQDSLVELLFVDGGWEAEGFEKCLQRLFRLSWHKRVGYRFFFGGPGVGAFAAAASSFARVSFVCAIVSKFCTVQ